MSNRSIVHVILDDRELVLGVRQLDPRQLGDLVRQVGLEDSGELLALATPEQLQGLADDELWRAGSSGVLDTFDAERFATWVEVLADAGAAVAARGLMALDEELLAHALSQQMIVLDLDRLAPMMSDGDGEGGDDGDLAEKILESSLSHELDELLLLSLRYRGWDAIIDALHELDRVDHSLLRRVLERICDASMNRVEEDGLCTVLTDAETLEEDARAGRDDRREGRGFVTGVDARALLELARTRPSEVGRDPVTQSYFRSYEPRAAVPIVAGASRLAALLRERGIAPARPMLTASSATTSVTRSALSRLRERDPALHARRVGELIYLANVLLAAYPGVSQIDAIDVALLLSDAGIDPASEADVEHCGLLSLFARGWSRAHDPTLGDDLSAAREAIARLAATR